MSIYQPSAPWFGPGSVQNPIRTGPHMSTRLDDLNEDIRPETATSSTFWADTVKSRANSSRLKQPSCMSRSTEISQILDRSQKKESQTKIGSVLQLPPVAESTSSKPCKHMSAINTHSNFGTAETEMPQTYWRQQSQTCQEKTCYCISRYLTKPRQRLSWVRPGVGRLRGRSGSLRNLHCGCVILTCFDHSEQTITNQ